MDWLSRIFEWLREQEAGFSAVAAIIVIGGVIFAGFRLLVRRRGDTAVEVAPSASAEPASAAETSPSDLDPLTVPGFEGRPAVAVLAFENRIESVREWPFDAPTLTRFFLYVAIPLGSWVGGALVERLLGAALD